MPYGRAVNDVPSLLPQGEELRDLLRRMLEVVIYGDGGVVDRRPEAAQQRVVLPVVAHQVDAPDVGITPRQVLDAAPAAFRASIVDQDDFPSQLGRAAQNGSHPADELGEDVARAMDGDHHGDAPGRVRRRRAPRPRRALRDGLHAFLFAQAPNST